MNNIISVVIPLSLDTQIETKDHKTKIADTFTALTTIGRDPFM